ncbi:MAG TPA: 3-dehydroquinate synthase [Dehalococcoidia bacterium]|nr:3-dehydroquinate synthase [Dehalococcoidia bacterium]
MGAKENIILTGFSTTGKSQVAREVASRLGWGYLDLDDEVVRLAGKDIPRIFQEDGEARFRELESQALREACRGEKLVIATGGGAILSDENRELMAQRGVVICLEARPETIYERLKEDAEGSSSPVVRPLLAANDPLQRIISLKGSRQPFYALADWTIHTDNLTVSQVSQEVVRAWQLVRGRPAGLPRTSCQVTTLTESYPILVDWGCLDRLGSLLRWLGLSGRAVVIGDETVLFLYGQRLQAGLEREGYAVVSLGVPPGESSKSLEMLSRLYDALVENKVERGDSVLAVGGGVVGDLAGFVAATFLRGLPLIQVPTTLAAMVDASIGGKVAVNHPLGKNLIGAFYQPRLVLADTQTLTTLPQRELTSGWAEVIKHGLILDASLVTFLEENMAGLIRLDPELTRQAISQSVALKAQVVSEDERETGRRTILNYGHTIGHALEAATGYERFLHGEAVAIGMMGAALLSQRLGLITSEVVERQRHLLEGFGLPTRAEGIAPAQVLQAMELDKKVRAGQIRWVLLKGMGEAVIRSGISRGEVAAVLEATLGSSGN